MRQPLRYARNIWLRLQRAWLAFVWKDAIVISNRTALAEIIGESIPMVTGFGSSADTCSGCGKTSVRATSWHEMHFPGCQALRITKLQSSFMTCGALELTK